RMWNSLVKNELGQMKVVQVRPSHVRLFYSRLSKEKYAHSTIKFLHNMIFPSFEVAVDDDIIRKNPAKRALGDYGEPEKKRTALSFDQQKNLLNFVKNSEAFQNYLPMLQVMIGTGLRCGELIGLTWKDVDLKTRTVSVNHQLIYKNYGDGCSFHVTMPKTEAGIREIPMSRMVARAFEVQRRLNFQAGIPRDVEIEGLSDFVFMSRSGRPMMPASVNFILRDIVKAYNKEENERAKRERRKPEELPTITAHILRHTACTRMAETDLDMKVVQYVMGHANISVTMEVYNHITDRSRIEKEIAKMDLVQIM
ncbi:MAG TPA: site-specific integrase, partial [Candidatus Mediterraneibacter excrementipullorum]|nr:site-specific integrase [Candidatus Mediterraneibacter excrementipullorum]